MSVLRHEVSMRRARVVPGKHGMEALMVALKEVKIKAGAIPVQMHQGNKEIQQLKNSNETPTVMLHTGHINETKTLPLHAEEELRQATSEDHYIGYIKRTT